MQRILADLHVPGMAVGVVRNGRVALALGVGHRDLERRLPVMPGTQFAIGSNTKSFTALLLAMLVEEGHLAWDEPVRRYLPEFDLADPVAARLTTPRDLLDHMTGLPRHDGMWYGRSRTRAEIFERLRYLEPSTTFRARWQYNNLMYLAAGQLAERITARSWEALIRERILTPLNMTSTRVTYREQLQMPGRAEPYELREHGLERVALRNIDNVAPAGAIGSTLDDMLKYVLVFLSDGRVDGRQVVSSAALRAIQTPRVLMGTDTAIAETDWPELGPNMYALGLIKTHYRGRMLVTHSGGIDGYTSMMSWMPHENLGVVVLTNSTSEASTIASYWLYDRLLGLAPIDWMARIEADEAAVKARGRVVETHSRAIGTLRPAADYAGSYEHPGYGTIVIAPDEPGRLSFTFDQMRTSVKHVSYDVFEADPGTRTWGIIPNLVSFTVSFKTDASGDIAELEIPFEPAVRPIVFKRRKSGD